MSMSSKPAITAPTSNRGGTKPASRHTAVSPQSSAAIALNMSWQLLIIVIIPVVGGHLLDVHFKKTATFMIIGMVIAVLGMIAVVRQTVRMLNGGASEDTDT
jgi:F0F1-type ATP synthase assembly protein I